MNNNTPFWGNHPEVLLNKNELLELWPTPEMSYESKLNSITRLILLLTMFGFIFTFSLQLFFIGMITILLIYFLYFTKFKEGFDLNNLVPTTLGESILGKKNNSQKIINPETLQENIKTDFYPTSSKNPFSNVLQTDIKYDPDRKSAPPAFNPQVYDDITVSTKKMVQDLNPTILNTNKQLFGDLYEQFNLDQSNRIFFSTANTRVANDQGAFANYLYGDMPSCRNNDTLECIKDNFRYILY
jgi:hypothetical protein